MRETNTIGLLARLQQYFIAYLIIVTNETISNFE